MHNFASRCGEHSEGLPRRPPNEPLTETSESLFCRRPVMRRVLACQTWNEFDGKYQGGHSHISLFLAGGVCSGGGPAWGLGCRICRLCYNPNGNNEHGGPWAQLDARGSIQKCNINKHQNALVTKTRKQRSSRRLPDVITIPWFKLSSWHRPWNTSSRSSAS